MTASFVLDASITLTWCFPDEKDDAAIRLLRRMAMDTGAAPSIWPLEIANAMVGGERRRRITRSSADEFIRLINSFNIEVDEDASHRALAQVLDTAREYDLSSYDASYLDLAIRRRLPLATADAKLATAATRAGVTLVD